MAFQAFLNDTFRRAWALQNSLNDTLRGLLGRTPYDVQIALDTQETRLVLSNTLRMEFRPAGGDMEPTSPVVLRSVLQNCRGVPFKGPRGLGGSRLKGPSKDRAVQGGRGAAGGWGGASQKSADLRFGVLERLVGEAVGEVYLPPTPLRPGASHRQDPETSIRLV